MSKTRAELRQDVLDELGETTGFYSEDDLNRWLSDAVEDVCVRVEPLVTTATVDLVHSTQEFGLPTDAITVKRVFIRPSSGASWVELDSTYTWEDMFDVVPGWEDTTSSTPTNYYWRDNVIGVWPKKASPTVTDGLRIMYAYKPETMTADADQSGLVDWLDKTLIDYAVWRGRLKDKDNRAPNQLAAYLAGVVAAGQKMNLTRKKHQPRIEVDPVPYRYYYNRRNRSERIRLAP